MQAHPVHEMVVKGVTTGVVFPLGHSRRQVAQCIQEDR